MFSFCALILGAITFAADPSVPLWQLAPFDRITLDNGDVHDVDPVRIPPGVKFDELPEDSYVGRPGLPPKPELYRSLRYRIRRQADGLEYELYGKSIDAIDLYEDLLLAESRRLLRLERFDEAFKHLEQLLVINADWPGARRFQIELNYREGKRRMLAGQWEKAFWSFVEVHREQLKQPEPVPLDTSVPDELATLIRRWFEDAVERGDFLEARRIIARVEESLADVPEATSAAAETKQKLIDRSNKLFKAGIKSRDQERWVDARTNLEQAVHVAPDNPEVRQAISELYQRQGHLRVGVEQLASFFGGPADWSPADARVIPLVHRRMYMPVASEDQIRWTSEIIESLERPEQSLNRRAIVTIRSALRWPDGDKAVTAVDVQRLLAESCRPGSAYYHPALARLVRSLETRGAYQLIIDFDRPQPRPEAWLTLPLIQIAHSGHPNGQANGLGPYITDRRGDDFIRYLARPNDPLAGPRPIQQVTEHFIPKTADRLRAFEEGRLDLVADLPPRQWANASQLSEGHLITLRRPTVYVLQFNFNRPLLRSRSIRRAMSYGLQREKCLEAMGLDPKDPSLVTTAPWPAGSFGYDSTVEPRPTELILARTLVSAVRRQQGSLPALRLVHAGREADRWACAEIARQMKIIGLTVNLVEFDPAAPVSPLTADLRYVGLTVRDPLFDTMTFLTRDNPSLADHASPWLRQALVQLVDVPNFTAARELLPRLHRILVDDVAVLPLWQYPSKFLASQRITGIAEAPEEMYEGIETWSVRPGFPPVEWSSAELTQAAP